MREILFRGKQLDNGVSYILKRGDLNGRSNRKNLFKSMDKIL